MIVKNPRNDVDVAILRKVFPDLLPDGREITHDQLETVLTMNRAQSRYRTVLNKWRRQLLQERGVWLDGSAAGGRGFVVLVPDEMVRCAHRGVRSAGRKFRKSLEIMSAPQDVALSEDMRHRRRLLEAAVEKITMENRKTLREVGRALTPPKQLPRTKAG
jgi:hypothetical protein